MERYELKNLYTLQQFSSALDTSITNSDMTMGLTSQLRAETLDFVASAIFGYFYNDLIAYTGEDQDEVKSIFMNRLGYEVAVKFPYWYRKYKYIKKLLTDEDLSLFQTSKVTSSSTDDTQSSGATIQKIATTPTGVTATTNPDEISIGIDNGDFEVSTNSYAEKYTNTQQKFANGNRVMGERSGTITREGSIDDLLNVLEKLPSSFANEVTKAVGKHFIFDYDGEERGYYETN